VYTKEQTIIQQVCRYGYVYIYILIKGYEDSRQEVCPKEWIIVQHVCRYQYVYIYIVLRKGYADSR